MKFSAIVIIIGSLACSSAGFAASANPDFSLYFSRAPQAGEEKYMRTELQSDIYGNMDKHDDSHVDRAVLWLNVAQTYGVAAFNTAACAGQAKGHITQKGTALTLRQDAQFLPPATKLPACTLTFQQNGNGYTVTGATEGCRAYTGAACAFTLMGHLTRVYQ